VIDGLVGAIARCESLQQEAATRRISAPRPLGEGLDRGPPAGWSGHPSSWPRRRGALLDQRVAGATTRNAWSPRLLSTS